MEQNLGGLLKKIKVAIQIVICCLINKLSVSCQNKVFIHIIDFCQFSLSLNELVNFVCLNIRPFEHVFLFLITF